jgi:hypothetical protein
MRYMGDDAEHYSREWETLCHRFEGSREEVRQIQLQRGRLVTEMCAAEGESLRAVARRLGVHVAYASRLRARWLASKQD